MSAGLDPRRTPFRPDLAAVHLKGRIAAERYVEGVARPVRQGTAALHGQPDAFRPLTSQLLFGEVFTVYEERDGWAWGQNGTDGYVGYVRADALGDTGIPATHAVTALRTFIFPHPDLKTPPMDALSLTSRLAVTGEARGYLELAGGGWVFAKHAAPLSTGEPDYVATAERFLGVPYLWGGRSSLGLDCSGLAQIALAHAGIPAPRDSDMQREEVGALIEGQPCRRGDLVFFPGHVGIMLDAERLLHATALVLAVTVEPLSAVADRAGGILAVRRFS
ncbi:MAG TPA: NlpC/P60 family protein [Azospirillaceae bacterium]|nr:NlpC/P60 family protein [Azospirillaceae bacterium]